MPRWQLCVGFQASLLGQLKQYIENLSSSESISVFGLSWEEWLFKGVEVCHKGGIRKLPFLVRCKDIETPRYRNSRLIEALGSAQPSELPVDDYLVFNLFIEEAMEQCQRLLNVIEPPKICSFGAAEQGLILKLMETLGQLIGLSYAFGDSSNIKLPNIFERVIVGAMSPSAEEPAIYLAMVNYQKIYRFIIILGECYTSRTEHRGF